MARTKLLYVLLVALLSLSGAAKPAVKKTVAKPKPKTSSNGKSWTLDKPAIIKLHGYFAMLSATTWTLDSFGIDIPLIGAAATMSGFDASDPSAKFFMRLASSALLFAGLTEIEFADNSMVQKFFTLYHIPLTLTCIAAAKNVAKGPLGWLPSAVGAAFTIGGLL